MGMSELRQQMAIRPDEVRRFQTTYHMRWSLSAAPLAVASLALATLYWQRRPRRVLTIGAICFGYWVLLMVAQEMAIWTMLPVIAILWLPNVAYAALAAALTWRARPVAVAD
jgi:lipopolysaccharide export LptBFGC system permease protein LptF